jgi:hypothetical protein
MRALLGDGCVQHSRLRDVLLFMVVHGAHLHVLLVHAELQGSQPGAVLNSSRFPSFL